jgi:alkylation response protein AidB-like acyl-CoA dehydrogenase
MPGSATDLDLGAWRGPGLAAWRAQVAKVAAELVAPLACEMDETDTLPPALIPGLAGAGLFSPVFPAGPGQAPDMRRFVVAVEEVAKVSGAAALALAIQALGAFPLEVAGSDQQKARWYPELAAGRALAAFALTEPGAGSDIAAVETRAEPDGGGWRITGTKHYISGAPLARLLVTFARTGDEPRDVTAFLCDTTRGGVRAGELHRKMGMRGYPVGRLHYEGYQATEADVLGEPGRGLPIALATLDRSRPGIAAQALGIAAGALDQALAWAASRVQFGRPVAEQQGVAFMLADMETAVEASRGLLERAADAVAAGAPGMSRLASMAKLHASDTAMRVTTDAVQVLGGAGYMRDLPVERMMRDAKVTQIYEGTNQIQRIVIARAMLDRLRTGTG